MTANLRTRGVQLLGATGIAVVASLIGAGAAAASSTCLPDPVGSQPFQLRINPGHGDMTTDPAAAWSTRHGCPAAYQNGAALAIVTHDGDEVNYHTASARVATNGDAPLSGTLNSSMGQNVDGDGLQADSTYEIVVRCFNADFDSTPVQSTFITINSTVTTWYAW
jgi:hypothetical protein